MPSKRLTQRCNRLKFPCSEREKLQTLNELNHFEKYGCFSETISRRVRAYANKILGRFQVRVSGAYEERKQQLIDSIASDIFDGN